MQAPTPDLSITALHRFGAKLAKPLQRLGIATVGDLLAHIPVRHEDLRSVTGVHDVVPGARAIVCGIVTSIENRRAFRRRMIVTEALITDATGAIRCTWFQQPYLAHAFRSGSRVIVAGDVVADRFGIHLQSPVMERDTDTNLHAGRLVPIYACTAGISQKQLRFLMHAALPATALLQETLPPAICSNEGLYARSDAVRAVHFPADDAALQRARERLLFDELLAYVLRARASRRELDAARAPAIRVDGATMRRVIAALPFLLTGAQDRALSDIVGDMTGGATSAPAIRPMSRLLNGDVGSGKTAVAAVAAAMVAHAGKQVAYLAPTEVLAVQQAGVCTAWLRPLGIRVACWTRTAQRLDGAPVTPKDLRAAVRDGSAHIVIGTHAILAPSVRFADLGLAIIDEQHRFGVDQRAALRSKAEEGSLRVGDQPAAVRSDAMRSPGVSSGKNRTGASGDGAAARSRSSKGRSVREAGSARSQAAPTTRAARGCWLPHLLSMTATPIPRTLQLSLLGDLAVSLLDERPRARKPVATHVVGPMDRLMMTRAVRQELDAGHQAFIVCGTIEDDGGGVLATATEAYERAQRVFAGARVGLLHGRMKPGAQQDVMAAFAAHALDILVATTIIEVGVDQPNATVMIIEDAERFGLSQLHQLRGRVGRGDAAGICFLATRQDAVGVRAHLARVAATTDGFALAELDLAKRGPGTLFGTVQSGRIAFPIGEMEPRLLERVRSVADVLLASGAAIAGAHLE